MERHLYVKAVLDHYRRTPGTLGHARPEDRRLAGILYDRGVSVVALQALLFGRPDLVLFESPERRSATLDYLEGVLRLASWLGAGPLVFGSPFLVEAVVWAWGRYVAPRIRRGRQADVEAAADPPEP